MKFEFKTEFAEFFDNAYEELEKTIEFRLQAMQVCQKILNENTDGHPNYNITPITNRQIDDLSLEKVLEFARTEM